MMIRRWFPLFATIALPLVFLGANRSQAGSFFGPSCYGSAYADEYPNRAHNVYGCSSGCPCTARHPFFKRHWARKHQCAPMNGAPVNAMPGNGVSVGVMPAPIAQAPLPPAPLQGASIESLPLPEAPATSARMIPSPAPLPAGPANPEPPIVNGGSKPPF
jgi:hypothetical protein